MKLCRMLAAVFALTLVCEAKDPKPKVVTPVGGVKTPGVLIPFANLKSEADLTLASPPAGALFNDGIALAEAGGIRRFDEKTNKAYEPSRDITDVAKPCGGLVSAFSSIWTATCGTAALAKVEIPAGRGPRGGGMGMGGRGGPPPAKEAPAGAKPDAPKPEAAKVEAPKPDAPKPFFAKPKPAVLTPLEAAPVARVAMAATEDSLWLLADGKTSLQRIDPQTNAIVADVRLPVGCASLLFAEGGLWVACPGETKLLRIDPKTNLVDKRIDVPAEPLALAAGDASIWVLARKEGKVARIDPKTNKVISTIELGIPNADGALAFGDGFLWASVPGFPVMRIVPAPADKPGTDKVVQQFHGEGGGWIAFGAGSVWVGSAKSGTVRRFDPKRIQATLAE